jgi:hypothetical protein
VDDSDQQYWKETMNRSLPLIAGRTRIDRLLDLARDVTLGTVVGIELQMDLM